MPSKTRPDPVIPDHEILRKIGGGAYGEVWLGRGVTGALRAVKVVWREDFDDARGFEREFEGILKFEPISRDHPGLVHILHVGRSPDGVSFYYYVMELGDDVRSGQNINAIEYEPRTLRADTKQAVNPQLDTATCIDVGLRLAEALDHLHERGLAHRDVKPSNVIFLNGRAKLADIGLVAARDQRTFVGTEGFVPPEGPGSAQADVYSLGKVLYEIATGKDRLDFPELPDSLPSGQERKRWLELNKIICDICEPRLSKRMITTASGLAEALQRLQKGKRRRRSGLPVWIATFILLGISGWAGYEALKGGYWQFPWKQTPAPLAVKKREVKIGSFPEAADVWDQDGKFIGTTPTGLIEVNVGDRVKYTIKKTGYRSRTIEEVVTASDQPLFLQTPLEVFNPPQANLAWEDHLGNAYKPTPEGHLSDAFVNEVAWLKFIAFTKRPENEVSKEFLDFTEDGKPVRIALASKDEAIAYCDWLKVGGMADGYLTRDYEPVPNYEQSFQNPKMSENARKKGLRPFRVLVRKINYGMIRLRTNPPGASVYINGEAKGVSGEDPIQQVKPGKAELLLVLEGYKPKTVFATVVPGEITPVEEKLEENQGVVFGKAWQNGIEMKFVPMGPDLMVSIWETRVADYEKFIRESGHLPARVPEFAQAPEAPVVYVTREDAINFCKWLTEFERKHERIGPKHEYRLPTDMEWSQMAGLVEEEGPGPGWREGRKSRTFPWGDTWPPEAMAGNYADESAALAPGVTSDQTISGYNDSFPYTSPVGQFSPNRLGIFDLSGNVQEWVGDDYQPEEKLLGILRGGGWTSYQQDSLYTGTRSFQYPNYADKMYGFRVVLAKIPVETLSTPLDLDPTPPEPQIPPDNG